MGVGGDTNKRGGTGYKKRPDSFIHLMHASKVFLLSSVVIL